MGTPGTPQEGKKSGEKLKKGNPNKGPANGNTRRNSPGKKPQEGKKILGGTQAPCKIGISYWG